MARLEVEQELRIGPEQAPRAVVDEQVAAEEGGRGRGIRGGEVGAEARHRVLPACSTLLRHANEREPQCMERLHWIYPFRKRALCKVNSGCSLITSFGDVFS